MHLLSADEALNVSDAIMLTLYGEEMFMRWKELKHEMQFVSEREYISWLIDVAHHYKGGSDENNTQSDVWQNMASEEEGVKCEGDGRDVGQYYGKRQRLCEPGPTISHWGKGSRTVDVEKENRQRAEVGDIQSDEVVISDNEEGDLDGPSYVSDTDLDAATCTSGTTNMSWKGMEEYGASGALTVRAVEDYVENTVDGQDLALQTDNRGGAATSDVTHVIEQQAPGKRYQCAHCSYSSDLRKDVVKHYQSVHLRIKPFKCPFCSHSSSLRYNLKCHVYRMHGVQTSTTT